MEKVKQFLKHFLSGNQTDSPDLLGQKSKRNWDIRRVSRTPLLIAIGIALTIGGCMTYTFALKSNAAQNESHSKEPQPKGQGVDNVSFLEQKQKEGRITTETEPTPDQSTADVSASKENKVLDTQANGTPTLQPQPVQPNPYQDVQFQQW